MSSSPGAPAELEARYRYQFENHPGVAAVRGWFNDFVELCSGIYVMRGEN